MVKQVNGWLMEFMGAVLAMALASCALAVIWLGGIANFDLELEEHRALHWNEAPRYVKAARCTYLVRDWETSRLHYEHQICSVAPWGTIKVIR